MLRLVGDADKPQEMRHHVLPLPDNGELVLSLWARADQPVPLTMHIIQDGWAKRVEKSHTMTTSWQKYEASWPVPTTREKDWFFLRLDVPKGVVPVEIADIRLEWKSTAPVAEVDPYEAAFKRGWQGAPQARTFTNLQPAKAMRLDFDLGNADFKSMAEYPISVVAESGEEFVRTDDVLRPLFAKVAGNIVVDGKLEDWAGAEWVELGESNLSKNFDANLKHRGGLDLSAKLAVAWSPQALAVAVVVTDDRHCPAEAPALAWQGDSVQVYLDPLNDATPESPNRQDDVEYLCSLIGGESYAWLAKGMEGNYRGDANKVEGFRDVEASCKIVRSGTTTIYELLLPRKPCLPSVEFTPDAAWGFSILINDNDGAGRKVGLTLSPAGTEPYGAPHLQRDLILVEK